MINDQITCSSELAESFNNNFINIAQNNAYTIENNKYFQIPNDFCDQMTGIEKILAKIIRIAAPVSTESLKKNFKTAIHNETVHSKGK